MKPANLMSSSVMALGAMLLASCASTDSQVPNIPGKNSASFAPIQSADNPTDMAEMAKATTLDVDNYRPQRVLPSCTVSPFKSAEPAAAMALALTKAQAYSDAQQGLGLMVLQNGKLIHAGFADGVDRKTKTVSASMMKSVLALTLGIAIDRSIIASVDDPVDAYITEWKGELRGKVTLRQILTMSSGLEPIGFRELLFAPDANAAALTAKLNKRPDTQFYYANSASQVLGAVLDRQVRNRGYDGYTEFLHRELWCPLGNGEALLWTDLKGMPRTYAGLHAGLADWARIGELIRNQGKANGKTIVSADWIAQMAQPSKANASYGFQLWLAGDWQATRRYNPDNPIGIPHSEPFAASDLVYFDGFGGQRVYVIPSSGLTIARVGLTNLKYDDAIIPNLIINAAE